MRLGPDDESQYDDSGPELQRYNRYLSCVLSPITYHYHYHSRRERALLPSSRFDLYFDSYNTHLKIARYNGLNNVNRAIN